MNDRLSSSSQLSFCDNKESLNICNRLKSKQKKSNKNK